MPRKLDVTAGVTPVLSVTEMRDSASQIARSFREDGIAADVVFFGSHRKLEGAVIPAALFTAFADVFEDLIIAGRVRAQRESDDGVRLTGDEVDALVGSDAGDRADDLEALRADLGLD